MQAFIYWNFNKKLFSVKVGGKVIAHANRIIVEDAEFRVSEAGRQRVLRDRVKNVHAGVKGRVVACDIEERRYLTSYKLPLWNGADSERVNGILHDKVSVYYNPYNVSHFIRWMDSKPLWGASTVVLCATPAVSTPGIWIPWGSEILLDLDGGA